MKRFAKWVEDRRKILGFARQVDLATAAGLSVSVVQGVESSGSLEGRSRASIRLLASSLRVNEATLWRLARGEIEDAPLSERSVDPADEIVEELTFLMQPEKAGLRQTVLARLSPETAAGLVRAIVDHLAGSLPNRPVTVAEVDPENAPRLGGPRSEEPQTAARTDGRIERPQSPERGGGQLWERRR